MAVSTHVDVIISAKNAASDVIKKVGNDLGGIGDKAGKSAKGMFNLKEVTKSAVADFKVIGALGIGAAAGVAAMATKAAFASARIDELTFALHAIGKANDITAKETDEAVEALRNNNIAHKEALQITSKFIQNELKSRIFFL